MSSSTWGSSSYKLENGVIEKLAEKEYKDFTDALNSSEVSLDEFAKYLYFGEEEYLNKDDEFDPELLGKKWDAVVDKIYTDTYMEIDMFVPTAEVIAGDEGVQFLVENYLIRNAAIDKKYSKDITYVDTVQEG